VKRVLIGLVALVAAPFVAGVSQVNPNRGLGHDAAHCAMRAALHPGAVINKCPTDPPPPPPVVQPPPTSTCTPSAPAPTGVQSIDGNVSNGVTFVGLPNWCVELTGTVTATALTDSSGHYIFTGLPDGTYTVCEVLQTGWTEVFPTSGPSCPTGLGWTFALAGYSGSFVNFQNNYP
jgi:hypothetical protein